MSKDKAEDRTNGRKYLPHSEPCFVCGEKNAAGLQTRFYVEDDQVKALLEPKLHHCGYPNVVHGGVVAAILDEAMGWAAARATGFMCFTAELTVRYVKPVPGDQTTIVETELVRGTRRLAQVNGRLVGPDGEVYGQAAGRFIPLSAEETLAVDDGLIYEGPSERVFDYLREDA